MIKVLPSISQEYRSTMSKAELLERLAQIVEPRQPWTRSLFKKKRSKAFEGEIHENGFDIRPIIHYRNSFLPCIRGAVTTVEGGSSIQLEMKLHPFVKFFMSMWLGMVGLGTMGAVMAMIEDQAPSSFILFPLVMWAFGYFLANKGFNHEAKPAQDTLVHIFNHMSVHPESDDLPNKLETY